jgi:hypothetical protein
MGQGYRLDGYHQGGIQDDNRAARTLLELREIWENSTKEERKGLIHIMIREVGVDVAINRVLWVKARPDYEPLFSILDGITRSIEYWLLWKLTISTNQWAGRISKC